MAYVGTQRTRLGLAAMALAAAALIGGANAASAASAQDATSAAAAPPAAAGDASQQPQSPWVKTCATQTDPNTPQICITSQEMWLTQDGSQRVSFSIQPTADPKKYGVGGFVPLGFVIPAGVALGVDGKQTGQAQYVQCNPPVSQLPPGCLITAQVDDTFVAALRKGTELDLVLTNAKNQQLPVQLSLAGFAKTYDGQGIDPVAARAQEAAQSKPLQDAARAAAQKLIDAQQKAVGVTPPAQ